MNRKNYTLTVTENCIMINRKLLLVSFRKLLLNFVAMIYDILPRAENKVKQIVSNDVIMVSYSSTQRDYKTKRSYN